MSEDLSFGRWLQQRRRALDLTQAELAQRVGCAKVTIHKIEIEERRPSKEIAERLAEVLQITREEWIGFLAFARGESSTKIPALPAHVGPSVPALEQETRTNLPLSTTPLIGREQEVAAVQVLLARADIRMLTVTGTGGIGKTRLALEVAAEMRAAFMDGVFLVALAPISDPTLVLPTIAQRLSVQERGEQSLLDSLKAYVRSKQLLLLLDNFEQVGAAAPHIADLLTAAPMLKILVTSRVPLHLSGEQEFPVPPLALPDHQHQTILAVDALLQSPAVALFAQRARAVKPDFVLTDEQAPVVAEICTRLDGLPLAIELAAARVKLLSPQALLTRLDKRLSLLTSGKVDQDPRHRTLRAAIDWSYQLLETGQQQLFARLAIFVGGWTPEAVEAVCNAAGDLPVDVLDGLASLLDQSLIQRVEGLHGEPRFTMLETIREYACERLDTSGEAAVLRQQHAAYYLTFAEQAEQALGRRRSTEFAGPQSPVWLARLEMEYNNLEAVLQWALEYGEMELVLRLAGALGPFWLASGHVSGGRRWLVQALTSSSSVPTSVRAKALRTAGALALQQGAFNQAHTQLEESLALFRDLGDRYEMAAAHTDLGYIATVQRDYEQAHTYLAESLALWRALGDTAGIATVLQRLGWVALWQGDLNQAYTLLEESLALWRALDDKPGIAWASFELGVVCLYHGDAGRARVLWEEHLALQHALGDKHGIALGLMTVGIALYEQGDYAQAQAHLHEGLTLLQVQGNRAITIPCLEGLAQLAGAQQQPGRAARLLGAAAALREALRSPVTPAERSHYYDCMIATLPTELGEEAFQAAWAEGRAMSWEQAIAYALAEDAESRAVGEL